MAVAVGSDITKFIFKGLLHFYLLQPHLSVSLHFGKLAPPRK